MLGVHGLGPKGSRLVQQGLREHLLCDACEQYINTNFEIPFKQQWLDGRPLQSPWPSGQVQTIQVDYPSFKLFHLSVLYRASISTLPTFSKISLGPHEGRIRNMLQKRDPGPSNEYPILGYAVIEDRSSEIVPFVGLPVSVRQNGWRCCGLSYGGVQWWIGTSSHRNPAFEGVAMNAAGVLTLSAIPMSQDPSMMLAGDFIRAAPKRHAIRVNKWKAASGGELRS